MASKTPRDTYNGAPPDQHARDALELFLRTHQKKLIVAFTVLLLTLLWVIFFHKTIIIDRFPLPPPKVKLSDATEKGTP
jgi:hypothetical protein